MNDPGICDVSGWEIADIEVRGSTENKWLRSPEKDRRELWLFKPVTVHEDGRVQGEDWAEVCATHLADLLGIPAARTRLAIRNGTNGSISLSVRPEQSEMGSGGLMISSIDDAYIGESSSGRRPRNRVGHNLDNIEQVLRVATPPPGYKGKCEDGFEVFAGFLLFDAWVANTDRHDENWGVLKDRLGTIALAPSFDHGSALGFGLTDKTRARLLQDPSGLDRWVKKGRAVRFEDRSSVALVEFAHEALQRCHPAVQEYWLGRLDAVQEAEYSPLLDSLSRMSGVARTFSCEILRINRGRLLHVS